MIKLHIFQQTNEVVVSFLIRIHRLLKNGNVVYSPASDRDRFSTIYTYVGTESSHKSYALYTVESLLYSSLYSSVRWNIKSTWWWNEFCFAASPSCEQRKRAAPDSKWRKFSVSLSSCCWYWSFTRIIVIEMPFSEHRNEMRQKLNARQICLDAHLN